MDYYPQIKMMINPSTRSIAIDHIRHHGAQDAILLIVLLYVLSLLPGAPVSIIAVITGICFGKFFGILINILGIGSGNVATIRLVSYFDDLNQKYNKGKIAKLFKNLKHPLIGLCVAYSIPFVPVYLISFLASRDREKFPIKMTVIAAIIGSIPVSIIYAVGGNALLQGHFTTLIVLIIIVIVILAGAYLLLRILTRRKHK